MGVRVYTWHEIRTLIAPFRALPATPWTTTVEYNSRTAEIVAATRGAPCCRPPVPADFNTGQAKESTEDRLGLPFDGAISGNVIYRSGLKEPRHMRFGLAFLCMITCTASALAQSGITNSRDSSGNLVRNTGMNPVRSSPQPSANNPNGNITSTLGPTAPINSRSNNAFGK
jgi:hypothetical protein